MFQTFNTLHSCHKFFPAGSRQSARGPRICETSLLDFLFARALVHCDNKILQNLSWGIPPQTEPPYYYILEWANILHDEITGIGRYCVKKLRNF